MDSSGWHAAELAGAELLDADRSLVILERQAKPARGNVDGLVLDSVALQRQATASFDDEDLADIAIGVSPDELVTPWLVNATARVGQIGTHDPRTSRSPATRSASRISSEVASVYTLTSGSVPDARIS